MSWLHHLAVGRQQGFGNSNAWNIAELVEGKFTPDNHNAPAIIPQPFQRVWIYIQPPTKSCRRRMVDEVLTKCESAARVSANSTCNGISEDQVNFIPQDKSVGTCRILIKLLPKIANSLV